MLRAPLRHVRALALPGIRHHLRMYWAGLKSPY
jgi:hypothetical protein